MKAAVLTISDGCYRGEREDLSGRALCEVLEANEWQVVEATIVPDEIDLIEEKILRWNLRPELGLIVCTGGTGLSARDVTPEAVRPLLDKEVPGLSELMRLRGLEHTPFASLSRSLVGVAHKKIILCLPGGPRGAVQSLEAVIEVLPHALEITNGRTRHEEALT